MYSQKVENILAGRHQRVHIVVSHHPKPDTTLAGILPDIISWCEN